MPANFPEVWRNRVEENLTSQDEAPWLNGVEELNTEVLEVGSGSASEQNIIHIPTTDFEPEVLINHTSPYPLSVVDYTDDTVTIQLDKYQTVPVSLSDDDTIGASYHKIDAATGASTRAISKTKYNKAIHALAPSADSDVTPVVATTGEAETGERRPLVYEDLVALKKAFDKMEVPLQGRRLVLCTDHWNDLLLDRKRFGDNFSNYREGTSAPKIVGFEIFEYVANPYFAGKTRKAWGATPASGDYQASVAFYVPNVAKKTGLTKQYFRSASQDPENQRNVLAYRHYFIAAPKRAKYIGAIVSEDA